MVTTYDKLALAMHKGKLPNEWWVSVDGKVLEVPMTLRQARRAAQLSPTPIMVLNVRNVDYPEPEWHQLSLAAPATKTERIRKPVLPVCYRPPAAAADRLPPPRDQRLQIVTQIVAMPANPFTGRMEFLRDRRILLEKQCHRLRASIEKKAGWFFCPYCRREVQASFQYLDRTTHTPGPTYGISNGHGMIMARSTSTTSTHTETRVLCRTCGHAVSEAAAASELKEAQESSVEIKSLDQEVAQLKRKAKNWDFVYFMARSKPRLAKVLRFYFRATSQL